MPDGTVWVSWQGMWTEGINAKEVPERAERVMARLIKKKVSKVFSHTPTDRRRYAVFTAAAIEEVRRLAELDDRT